MREAYTRLFEPPDYAGQANPRHLEVGPYKDLGRDAALGVARANAARDVEVEFPDGDTFAPTQIRVTVRDPATSDAGGRHHETAIKARAEAELAPPAQICPTGTALDTGPRGARIRTRTGGPRPPVAGTHACRPGRLGRQTSCDARATRSGDRVGARKLG